MKRYAPKDLRGMTLKALAQAGGELGLEFTKNHSRAERAKRILAAYAERDLAAENSPHLSEDPVGGPKPEFESLIDGADDTASDVVTSTRGGARPGAGRPMGQTSEKARMEHLSERPHPVVQSLLCGLFDTWASVAKCPEIALSQAEAFELALPWTQTLEYMGIAQRIPPWLALGVMTLWTTASMVKQKAALARAAANARRKMEPLENPSVN